MPPRPRKGVKGASTASAVASKMINAAESKKNTKPLSLAMSSDEDLLLLFTKLRALFLGFYVIKINDLNLTLNLCFSMFIIRKHHHMHTQESSYHIHLPWNSTSYNSAQLCSSSVGYIYFMLAQASIYPPLRFSLDYEKPFADIFLREMG